MSTHSNYTCAVNQGIEFYTKRY
ncbi:hypothetical protein BN2475_140089 [Paraburkholderia ribeironis]|uniref:Uncharacterized protein n=1 Tax=Paraburkholderia ribeironis TaxID=1247936 RepID=A0A1N7RT42_9BURK|nr:hypothetical protein BN2475_140089 [Paraburkholderia ribeironis]